MMAAPPAWRDSLAFRLNEPPEQLTIGFTSDGLLHLNYSTAGGYRVRQVCTFRWFVERLLAGGTHTHHATAETS